ncbi:excinuclease ABC subunit UvrB [Candidatus Parvarchaeota archaeon]|nr:excinuclease ABC subunit UvrB [Candidatus Parvarchaeota archaeon]
MSYQLCADYKPTGDQPQAIEKLINAINSHGGAGIRQTLLGVTGSGKTYTIANVIAKTGKSALIISHNKTLAAQLYSEFCNYFPKNRVGYFVSYYDYYQPESYIPQTDTYIEKTAQVNEKIEQMRLAATANLMSGEPCITIATVSCIYGIGSPKEWRDMSADLSIGQRITKQQLIKKILDIQYQRNDISLTPGTFRSKGDIVEVALGYSGDIIRISFEDDTIEKISVLDPLTFEKLRTIGHITIFPARHYVIPDSEKQRALRQIRQELEETLPSLGPLEAERLAKRTKYDLEMIEQLGYCNGIENYSRHFDNRTAGQPPYCLLDFLPQDALIVIDESHVTIPQLHGMYKGDYSRKKALIENGFRLPSAFDNRPLKWEEAENYFKKNVIFVSATPDDYEKSASAQVVEQLVRPTGLLDPIISVRQVEGQIADLLNEVKTRAVKNERVLVTTLTKRMAEDLTDFIAQKGVRVRYLHSEVENLQRTELIRQLRLGEFDCLVGINLLREGLDIPEVSLVAILDADKEGFLRNSTSLIQTMGRAARNANGTVIMYAGQMTGGMKQAIEETNRRRAVQEAFNKEHGITPRTIIKAIAKSQVRLGEGKHMATSQLSEMAINVEAEMKRASEELDFERAIELRDRLAEITRVLSEKGSMALKTKGKKKQREFGGE